MGCDIHAHIEVKISGTWYYYAPAEIMRNYIVFAKMADVRNWDRSIIPISKPKGLPSSTTNMTKFHSDNWNSDGHSHSWLSYDEMVELVRFVKEREEEPWDNMKWTDFDVWLFDHSLLGFKEYPNKYPQGLEDIRMIFWFDN